MRHRLFQLLGGWPHPDSRDLQVLEKVAAWSMQEYDGVVIERLRLPCSRRLPGCAPYEMPALLCRPAGDGPFPVILYCHAHGNHYAIGKQELLDGRPALSQGAYGVVLAKRGFAALAIDLPCFGERSGVGESALSKALLWRGDTLFGVMLRELAACLDYLQSRTDIDDSRIMAYGLSMGATLSWWLTALDERIHAVAEVCCFADLRTLIELERHDAHGWYLTVPGLLASFSTARIAALIIPRAHLCAVGGQDPLTPPEAIHAAADALQQAYRAAGAGRAWQLLVEPGSGHVETPRMRQAVLDFFDIHGAI